jgi:hypothetical protein
MLLQCGKARCIIYIKNMSGNNHMLHFMLFVNKPYIWSIARAISAKVHGKPGFAQKKENKFTEKSTTKEGENFYKGSPL